MTEMVVDLILGVPQCELHLTHQEAAAKSEVDENIPGTFVELILHAYNFEVILALIDLLVYTQNLLTTAHALAPHDIHHAECYQVHRRLQHDILIFAASLVEPRQQVVQHLQSVGLGAFAEVLRDLSDEYLPLVEVFVACKTLQGHRH